MTMNNTEHSLSDTDERVIIYLFLCTLGASFLIPYKIYPYFTFLLISTILVVTFFVVKKIGGAVFFVFHCLYVFWGVGVYLFSREYSNDDFAIKMMMNSLLLISFSLLFSKIIIRRKILDIIFIFIFFIIFINLIQILYDYASYDLWHLPFNLDNSASSDVLNETPRLIGEQNKNIWASKVVLLYSIFSVIFFRTGKKQRKQRLLYISCSVLCLLFLWLSCSRTAQVLYVMIIFIQILLGDYTSKRYKFFLILIVVISFLFAISLQSERYQDISFTELSSGHNGDGFKARLILWATLLVALPNFSINEILFGHGILYAQNLKGWVFTESNLHNVFLNMFVDLGFVGVLLYTGSLLCFFLMLCRSDVRGAVCLFTPLIFCMLVQYTGYDFDLSSYLVLSLMVINGSKSLKRLNE